MKIEVGDRVTYKYFDYNLKQMIEKIAIIEEDGVTFTDDTEIIKIERPNWEVVEEKKELLTEEERKFLKFYIKNCLDFEISNIYRIAFLNCSICIQTSQNCNHWGLTFERGFDKVEKNKEYSPKELRIGGINYEFCISTE